MPFSITRRACDVRRFAFLFSLLLLAGAIFPSLAFAQDSVYCPQVFASVARGSSVQIDVSDCDGPFDGGMSEPFAGFGASSGAVTIGANSGGMQFVTYAHDTLVLRPRPHRSSGPAGGRRARRRCPRQRRRR